jgi:hypothetical protein
MAVAFMQEFAIGDRSTQNYDFVKERLAEAPVAGLIIHTAGFDDTSGVFRVLDVWESREQAERFLEYVMSVVDSSELPGEATPPTRESYYELHDVLKP